MLHEIEIGITKHKPFFSSRFKIDLDSRMCALPLTIEYYAVAEFAVPHSLAEAHAKLGAGRHAGIPAPRTWAYGTTDPYTRADFFHQCLGNLGDKTRRL